MGRTSFVQLIPFRVTSFVPSSYPIVQQNPRKVTHLRIERKIHCGTADRGPFKRERENAGAANAREEGPEATVEWVDPADPVEEDQSWRNELRYELVEEDTSRDDQEESDARHARYSDIGVVKRVVENDLHERIPPNHRRRIDDVFSQQARHAIS